MKKLTSFLKIRPVFVLALVLTLAGCVWVSYADQADELDYHTAVTSAVAVADASSGTCAEVTRCGALLVRENYAHSVVLTADGWVTCNPAIVYSVIFAGDGITAGDDVILKDGSAACGPPKIHLEAEHTDGSWIWTSPVGVMFADRVFVDVTISGGEVFVTVVYTAPDG